MPKNKSYYECQNCGHQSPKWSGQCPECGKWNILEEVEPNVGVVGVVNAPKTNAKDFKIKDIHYTSQDRLSSGNAEFDRVLGGGFVKGQATLLAGEPGIGKSTLLLQLANSIKLPVYYLCGEESPYQVKERYTRLGLKKDNITLLENTFVETITQGAIKQQPSLLIVDSIHSLFSARYKSSAGTISQIKECSQLLVKFAKDNSLPLILVGQINKQGDIAGPKTLEHLVDTVMFLEGDSDHTFRVCRSTKNRFGSVNEIGLFTMDERGMVPVENPSEYLLSGRVKDAFGSCVCMISEGTRNYAIEVQVLLNKTSFGYPKRTSNGFSLNRFNLLAAVVQDCLKIRLFEYDMYLNIASGLTIKEPAADLAVCAAIVSAYNKTPLIQDSVYWGEVGLNGEVRPVKMQKLREKEALKVGLKATYSPENIRTIRDIKLRK